MASARLLLADLNGDCTITLIYDDVTLAASAIEVLNPSSSLTVTLTKSNGQAVTQAVPVHTTPLLVNLQRNFLTLIRDPVDGSICLPTGWSYSVVS